MKAVFYMATSSGKKSLGEITLENGIATWPPHLGQFATAKVRNHDTKQFLTTDDGEEYLRWLPRNYRGAYYWIELVDEPDVHGSSAAPVDARSPAH